MATLKCKLCGGELQLIEDENIAECEFCGSKQTVPTIDNDRKQKLYDRANKLRINCDFDKAAGVFESIVNDYPDDAENYWGLILCKYGIEYVDDPATGRKVPTCHRSSYDSIMDDADFEMVMENAAPGSRSLYRMEAKQIEVIRQGILEVSGKEAPYDIFICYKETDELGDRTIDSVLAQDIYDTLTDKGYRVFFSRISLEDKLGTEYEPYIFAALNSAKVMLAFGTSYDYYNAVWVKNEWSRFLKLMASDKEKYLIPCYKDIDAYDIPKDFAKFQAQDLGKVGATQDLVRGIDKIFGKDKASAMNNDVQPQVVQQLVSGGPNTEALLNRGFMNLEDGIFQEAKSYFNRALDSDSTIAEAYLGLFMVEISAKEKEQAKNIFVAGDFIENRFYKRAKQFAGTDLENELLSWENNRQERLAKEKEEERRKAEAERKRAEEKAEAERKRAEEEAEAARIRAVERKNEEQRQKEFEKKCLEEMKSLQKQLDTGDFEFTTEEKEKEIELQEKADQLNKEAIDLLASIDNSEEKKQLEKNEILIGQKQKELSNLGFFKRKEKRVLQEKIVQLKEANVRLSSLVRPLEEKFDEKRKEADLAVKVLDDYKIDCQAKWRVKLCEKLRLLKIRTAMACDVIEFGKYPVMHADSNEPIEWKVLERTNNRVLLITRYGIDAFPYHSVLTGITWQYCSLRKWLNDDFVNSAFTQEEQEQIILSDISADKNPCSSTYPGNPTKDKVFLLSIPEVEKYFSCDEERVVWLTEFAKRKVAYTSKEGTCYWWLRSPGDESRRAATVRPDGSVLFDGSHVGYGNGCIRPALWLDLSNPEL